MQQAEEENLYIVLSFYVSYYSRVFVFTCSIRTTEKFGSVFLTMFLIPFYFLVCPQRLVVCIVLYSAGLHIERPELNSWQAQKFVFSPVVQTCCGAHPACDDLGTSSCYSDSHSASDLTPFAQSLEHRKEIPWVDAFHIEILRVPFQRTIQ